MKRTQRPTLLLINGIVLGVIATAQFVLDFVAYWTGFGPTGPTLHQNLTPWATPRRMASPLSWRYSSSSAATTDLRAGILSPPQRICSSLRAT
jgi:hypothetical protein